MRDVQQSAVRTNARQGDAVLGIVMFSSAATSDILYAAEVVRKANMQIGIGSIQFCSFFIPCHNHRLWLYLGSRSLISEVKR